MSFHEFVGAGVCSTRINMSLKPRAGFRIPASSLTESVSALNSKNVVFWPELLPHLLSVLPARHPERSVSSDYVESEEASTPPLRCVIFRPAYWNVF
jgi:hypothetical protein